MKKNKLFYMIDEGGNVLEASRSPAHWEEKYNIDWVDVAESCFGTAKTWHEAGFSKVKFKMVEV